MQDDDAGFTPRGAVAFFGAMMLFYAAFWLLILFLMGSRS
jgi:hypothetical protein